MKKPQALCVRLFVVIKKAAVRLGIRGSFSYVNPSQERRSGPRPNDYYYGYDYAAVFL
jgi:hypothetical protein